MALTGTYVPSKAEWVRNQVEEYEASGGEKANTLPGTKYPIVVVTSVGAKSGNLRKNPVMRVERDGAYLAVASKGGAPDHPGWYKNIEASPEVEVQVGTRKTKARARTVTGEERARLWQQALEFWPPYADYQRKTEREIPVVVLEPIA